MDEVIIRKIVNEKATFYIRPTWSSNSFKLTVIDGLNAWSANITEEKIAQLAKERQKSKDDYFKSVRESINNSKPGITFDLINSGSSHQLFMYLLVGRSKINFFVTDVEKIDYPTCLFTLLDEMNMKNLEFAELLQKKENEKEAAVNDLHVFEKKLQEFTDAKANWEKEIYSNFLLILNEKKKRISFLTSLLQSKKYNGTADTKNTTLGQVANKTKEVVSESESDKNSEEYDTDKEDEPETVVEQMDTQPSTSKRNDLLTPDSPPPLLLPKRIKSSTNTKAVGPIKATVVQVTKEKTPEPDITKEEHSPVLTFNTQDLIDRM